jgi:hypothetical protein
MKEAHLYLISKGVKTKCQIFTASAVEQMLNEFA